MKIYKFTFAGSELIVRAQALSGDHRWRQGMRDWEHAWYSFHDTRHREEDLEASWYPMALTQTSVILRREAQPVLAAATCLLAIDVDARIALSRIPPHVRQHVRSFTSFGGPYIGYARQAHMDDLDPFVASDLPRLEQVRTHEIHENADGPYLDELIKAKYRSLKRLRGLKRWHLCPRQLSALTRSSEHPFVGLRAIAGHASFSFKQVVHIFGIWPGPNYPHHEEVHGCLVSTNLHQSIIWV